MLGPSVVCLPGYATDRGARSGVRQDVLGSGHDYAIKIHSVGVELFEETEMRYRHQ